MNYENLVKPKTHKKALTSSQGTDFSASETRIQSLKLASDPLALYADV